MYVDESQGTVPINVNVYIFHFGIPLLSMNMLSTSSLNDAAWRHLSVSPSRCPGEGSTLALVGLTEATSSHMAREVCAAKDAFRIESVRKHLN